MSYKLIYHPVVQQLIGMISEHQWQENFDEAIAAAGSNNVAAISQLTTTEAYIHWINDFLYWIPTENSTGTYVNDALSIFYFILDQEPLLKLQNKVEPSYHTKPLTPLSKWMVAYADAVGAFMDTPESLTDESEATFFAAPIYNMQEYIRPHGGWKSFNQLFARNFKPGARPVAAIADPTVAVFPTDCTFVGQWEIRSDSHVTTKGMHWLVNELLEDSPYQGRFAGGQFMHAFLSPMDYHRLHAPIGGKVLEARVIPGQVYLEVEAVPGPTSPGQHQLATRRVLTAPNSAGYQFAQARGLVVLDTPVGLVAMLPIGMCQVSSVIMTAEVGVTVRKGEELSYFQFGGSDVIVLFEAGSNASFMAQPGVHYKMGTRLAQLYPVG